MVRIFRIHAREKVLEDKTIVVIGNKTQIEQEKSLFDVIHELY